MSWLGAVCSTAQLLGNCPAGVQGSEERLFAAKGQRYGRIHVQCSPRGWEGRERVRDVREVDRVSGGQGFLARVPRSFKIVAVWRVRGAVWSVSGGTNPPQGGQAPPPPTVRTVPEPFGKLGTPHPWSGDSADSLMVETALALGVVFGTWYRRCFFTCSSTGRNL